MRLEIASTWDGHPITADECATVVLHPRADGLEIEVAAPYHGDPAPPAAPGPTDRLWEFEVVEVFVARKLDGSWHYLEVELSPHGHHLVLRFDAPRRALERALPLMYTARIDHIARRWSGHAKVPAEYLPYHWEDRKAHANAFALHGVGDRRRYLAYAPLPGPQPDFHQPDRYPLLTRQVHSAP